MRLHDYWLPLQPSLIFIFNFEPWTEKISILSRVFATNYRHGMQLNALEAKMNASLANRDH